MKYNPFKPGSIVSPGMFSGRGKEIDAISRCFFQTCHGNPQHFAIIGERGIGKSSLLLFIQLLARGDLEPHNTKKFNFITLNIELKQRDTFLDIVAKLGSELKEQLSGRELIKQKASDVWDFLSKWEILGIRFHKEKSDVDENSQLNEFAKLLHKLTSEAIEFIDGVAILIDEADKPSESAQLGEMIKLLTERLSKLQCNNVIIGLAGLPSLFDTLAASHESSPRIFEGLTLFPLEKVERKQVIHKGLVEANTKNDAYEPMTIDDDALDLIAQLSEGYPHFIQQFSYCAFEDAIEHDMITKDNVLRGALDENGALSQLGEKFFSKEYFTKINSDDYRLVLDVMAEHGDSWITRTNIISDSKLKPKTVDNALRALKERNIIVPSELNKGQYRLPSISFATWIKAQELLQSYKNHKQIS